MGRRESRGRRPGLGARSPLAAPEHRYEVLTPSMISTASVANTLKATREVVIIWIWPVDAFEYGSYSTLFCVRTPTITCDISATMMYEVSLLFPNVSVIEICELTNTGTRFDHHRCLAELTVSPSRSAMSPSISCRTA